LTPKEEKTQDWAEIHRKSHTLLSSFKKDFERQKGGQELRNEIIPMFDRNEEIFFKGMWQWQL